MKGIWLKNLRTMGMGEKQSFVAKTTIIVLPKRISLYFLF
jgi:hypothetical protein